MKSLKLSIVGCFLLMPSLASAQASERLPQLVYQDCMPVHVKKFKKENKEKSPEAFADLLCGMIAGFCAKDAGGKECRKGITGYDLNRDDSGPSQLFQLSSTGDADSVRDLLAVGYSPNAPLGGPGWTPLMGAAAAGHEKIVQILLDHGADPNARNNLGRSALMFASNYGFAGIVSMLLAKGADPNAVPDDDDGWSALMVAAMNGHVQVVELLLQHGADQRLKDKSGKTALDLAEHAGHADVLGVLKRNDIPQ